MHKKVNLVWLGLALWAISTAAQTTVTNNNDGATNNVPVYTGSSALGNSVITQSNGNVGIGTTSPSSKLDVIGGPIEIGAADFSPNAALHIESADYGGWNRLTQMSPSTASTWALNLMASTDASGNDQWWTWGVNNNVWTIEPNWTFSGSTGFFINSSGNVGIGTTSPGAKLEVNGRIALTGGSGGSITFQDGTQQTTAWTGVLCGGDYAEAMNAAGGREKYEPGDVLVLASGDSSDVQKSAEPYSTMVAGIFATRPGVVGRREALAKSANDIPMAMIGVVPTKVSAENGPIQRGDLLVTSSKPGYAMKGTDRGRMLGAVIGKAMGSLNSGTGVIEVLVTLQ